MLLTADNAALVLHQILLRQATGCVLRATVPDLSLAADGRHLRSATSRAAAGTTHSVTTRHTRFIGVHFLLIRIRRKNARKNRMNSYTPEQKEVFKKIKNMSDKMTLLKIGHLTRTINSIAANAKKNNNKPLWTRPAVRSNLSLSAPEYAPPKQSRRRARKSVRKSNRKTRKH